MKRQDYQNAFGYWTVKTPSENGSLMKNLGTFRGYIDEIALNLADQCHYSLEFTKVPDERVENFKVKASSVNVIFDIQSGTWNMSSDERVNFFQKILKDRPTTVSDGQYYASVTLHSTQYSEEDLLREKALAKLTPEEIKALGIAK